MDFELLPIFSTLLPILASVVGFLGLTRSELSDDLKIQLALFLENYAPSDFAKQTKRIFDSVFGDKLFSTRSFSLSCLMSIVTVGLAYLVIFGPNSEQVSSGLFFRIAAIIVVLNFVPDFLSLCQTRFILNRMVGSNSASYQFAMTFADFVLSAGIIFLYLGAYFFLFHEHTQILVTPLGVDVLQVVVLSTMIFSILNFGFSIAMLLIVKTPKEMIYRFIDKPFTLLGMYTVAAIGGLAVLPVIVVGTYKYVAADDWLASRFPWIVEVNQAAIPAAAEILAVMVAFLFLIYLSVSALSQCAQTYKAYAQNSKIFLAQLTFTAILLVFLILKVASPSFLNSIEFSPFISSVVESYLVPDGLPKWQIASLLNGVTALLLTWYILNSRFDFETSKPWAGNFRNWCVRTIRIFSACLSAYTISVLVYVTASIQWDLLPICDAWTPWQDPNAGCLSAAKSPNDPA